MNFFRRAWGAFTGADVSRFIEREKRHLEEDRRQREEHRRRERLCEEREAEQNRRIKSGRRR